MKIPQKIKAGIELSFANFFKRRGIDAPPELIADLEREAQYRGFILMMAAVDRISQTLTDEHLKRLGKGINSKLRVDKTDRTN